MDNYYQEEGCCLTCEDQDKRWRRGWYDIYGDGCLCYDCKCRRCIHLSDGSCDLAGGTTWEDYEDMAREVKIQAVKQYSGRQINLKAVFSNGTIEKEVHYFNVFDIPISIIHLLKPPSQRYRTLLLKSVELNII